MQEEETYLLIRGMIADLPKRELHEVEQYLLVLRDMVKNHPLASLAIVLIGADMARNGEK